MYTIGNLARIHGISRSTLLYYDRIGLLRPARRAKGEYRMYSEHDATRLIQIRQYRDAGLSIDAIRNLLSDSKHGEMREILEKRLNELNDEILTLREQQHLLATLIGSNKLASQHEALTEKSWIRLLKSAGFSTNDMHEWHARFEQTAPDKHDEFLRRLRIPSNEIKRIRKQAAMMTITARPTPSFRPD